MSFRVSDIRSVARELASTMPSYPTLTSTTPATPFSAHVATSFALMRREALAMSGWPSPIPVQNSLSPPPEPVASTIGVLNDVVLPNRSATAVENGNTVEDPTMRIRSRASAAPATAAAASSPAISVFLIRERPLLTSSWRRPRCAPPHGLTFAHGGYPSIAISLRKYDAPRARGRFANSMPPACCRLRADTR